MRLTRAFACAGVLALLACGAVAYGAPQSKRQGPVVKVTVVVAGALPGGDAQSPATSLRTDWYTPQGDRVEESNGVFLYPAGQRVSYQLDTKARQAERSRLDGTRVEERIPLMGGSSAIRMRKSMRHSTLLGYRCEVQTISAPLPAALLPLVGGSSGTSGEHREVRMEIWTAMVKGLRAQLRFVVQAPGAVMIRDAVRVEILPRAPEGLLEVPAGYTIVDKTLAADPPAK